MVIINGRGKRRPENDFYPTPFPLAYQIVEALNIPGIGDGSGLRFLDPGCGDGVFGRAIRVMFPQAFIMGVDVVNRMTRNDDAKNYDKVIIADYLDPKSILDVVPHNFDYIVGNPPYSLAETFIRHSWGRLRTENARLCFLLKLAFLEGKARAADLYSYSPPQEVKVLAGRPSFTGNGKTNDYAFALFIWGKERAENPVLSWLQWHN